MTADLFGRLTSSLKRELEALARDHRESPGSGATNLHTF